jgi:hypothetical protein
MAKIAAMMPNAEDPTAIARIPATASSDGVAQYLTSASSDGLLHKARTSANQRPFQARVRVAGVFGAHPGIAAFIRFELQMRADFSLEVVLTLVPCRPLAPPAHVAPP